LVIGNSSRNGASRSVLVVGIASGGSARASGGVADSTRVARQGGDSPQALINRADIKVDLNFVILYGITYTPTFVVFICSLIAIKLHKTFAGD